MYSLNMVDYLMFSLNHSESKFSEWVSGGWQTKFNVTPGPGLWSLVLGPSGQDQGPDLDLT